MKQAVVLAALVAASMPGHLMAQERTDADPAPAAASTHSQLGSPFASPFAAAFEDVSALPIVPGGWSSAGVADTDTEAASVADLEVTQQVTGRSGRTYIIAGAAALVGGLLIGDEIGNLIAAGGVVLAVYGIILYY